jgi:protein tyrosine phosphatase (PTP) superfamily phosphohydrolase (DUF442 family)
MVGTEGIDVMTLRQCALACIVLAVVNLPGCAYLDSNFRTVEPNAFYRSGQLTATRLAQAIEDHGLATVINLRGATDDAWYLEEVTTCASYDVAHRDLDWSMHRLPAPESLAEYVGMVQTAGRPMLVHCQGGTHRAGIASAVYVLLHGGDLDQARRQLDMFFGDAPIGHLLTLYEGSDLAFADWTAAEYPQLYAAHEAARQGDTPAIALTP